MEAQLNMPFDSEQTNRQIPISPSEALALKNAALQATLSYLEHKNPENWFKDELAYRLHRLVEKALECSFQLDETRAISPKRLDKRN